MILKFDSIDMDSNYHKDRLLEKTLSVIKSNIDENDIKREVYSVDVSDDGIGRPDYIKVSLNKNEYADKLQFIMDYFIENEWYEDCVEIKEYQDKLKKLQNNNEQITRTETSTVEAEL